MNQRHLPLGLLAVALFLCPLIGGRILMDLSPLEPGLLPLLGSILGGSEVPLLSHALISLFFVAAACIVAMRRKVVQLPSAVVSALATILGALVVLSVATSSFRAASLASMAEWLLVLIAFYAAATIAGHGLGPRVLLGATVAGCALLAAMGVLEYAANSRIDPTWRIFGTWMNANVLAGMLLFGLFAGLGLTATAERTVALIWGVATSVIGLAFTLTQSRGGFLACGVGLVVLCVTVATTGGTWRGRWIAVGRIAASLGFAIVLATTMAASVARRAAAQGDGAAATALTRLASGADHDREQSSAFRKQLWLGTARNIAANPAGSGIGTFRYESSRSGLATSTHFAHQTYLQLASEVSPVGALCLIGLLAVWTLEMLKGHRRAPQPMGLMRSAILAAIVASAAHNVVDSDLYHFGIGVTFFMFLGIGLQLAADGLSPEVAPRPGRWGVAALAAVPLALLGYLGVARLYGSWSLAGIAEVRSAVERGDMAQAATVADEAAGTLSGARGMAPFDGELWYQGAFLAKSPDERLRMLATAVANCPSPKYLRALGREQLGQGRTTDARLSFTKALERDPNNLPALLQLMRLDEQTNDLPKAIEDAKRLIAVEKTPYYQIRSLPQLVATETLEGRAFLAEHEASSAAKIALLQPALDGYLAYMERTLPLVLRAAQGDPPMDYGGENLESASRRLGDGLHTANVLGDLYRTAGRSAEAAEVVGAGRAFADALAALRSDSR